ncbi:MAG: hypothetical protein E7481_09015 [Ruminococcaceae bacterium]|nr:hypothetical protein [Oscillospiraceae bacterium]
MNDKWIKLDNAAKIFPATVSGPDTKVFRFSCELFEDVDPEILKEAVAEAAEVFDVFNYIIKKGLFWYYFEKSDLRPIVREEYKPICGELYNKEKKGLLYEVTYYKKRINFEIFHALSDGTGALMMLECIVNKYISKKLGIPEPELSYDASNHEKENDSFYHYYEEKEKVKKSAKKRRKAYKFRNGTRFPEDRLSVITGHIDLAPILEAAHQNETTVTGYLTALLFCAIGESMPRRSKKMPIVMTIPINLRKHFPSASARNFFATVNIGYNFKKAPNDFESVVRSVTEDLKRNLSQNNLEHLITKYTAIENNFFVRLAPLGFKNFCLKVAHDYSMQETSGTFSNIGKAILPKEIEDHVRSFDFYNATKQIQVCAASYRNTLSVSFTSCYDNNDIPKAFFRKLTDMGIHIEITSNTDTFA